MNRNFLKKLKTILSVPLKLILLYGIIPGCKEHAQVQEDSIFESTIESYVNSFDTLSPYKNDGNFNLLKAYVRRDTAFFIQFNNDLSIFQKGTPLPDYFDKCNPLPALSKFDYTESYRLRI